MKTKPIKAMGYLTPEQKALWVGLKDGRLAGRRFSIRKRKDRKEIDFFCESENLSIEISDDSDLSEESHFSTSAEENEGRVLHFPISRVRVDLGRVLAQIQDHLGLIVVASL